MDRRLPVRAGENAFERVMGILGLIDLLPESMSDEDVEGVAAFVNPDLRNTVRGLFKLEAARSVNVFFLKSVYSVLKKAQQAREEGKKVVLIPITFPPEIIFAFANLVPICTELIDGLAVNVCAGQGERYLDFAASLGLPDSLCSSNTITIASLCMGNTLTPDAIVSNSVGSCDPNAKVHAFAADYLHIPQFILEKPIGESAQAKETYFRYLLTLIGELEEFAHEKLSERRLREVLERACRGAELYREIWEVKKLRPCPVPNIFNLTFMATRAQLWGTQEAVEIMRRMVEVCKEGMRRGEYAARDEAARVYISYIPYLFDLHGMYTWTEERGITLLGDMLTVQFFPRVDMASREGMLRALSEIAFEMPMTRQMGADLMSVRWLEDIAYAVEDLGADCCIYLGHHACKHAEGSVSYLRREMMKRMKVPTLILKGDGFDRRFLPMSMAQDEIGIFVDKVVSKKGDPMRRKRP